MSGEGQAAENIWDQLYSGGYVADAWIYTGTNNAVVPRCASTPGAPTGRTPTVSYNRSASSAFSLNHLYDKELFTGGDCTWFSSQALWAGGLPKSSAWTSSTWNLSLVASKYHYPGPTKDAADANDLVNYLLSTGQASRVNISWSDNTASGAEPGDIIAYHWNYKDPATGKVEPSTEVDHLAFVYGLNKQGYPDVAQHSPAVIRYWSWDPGGNGHPAGWIQQVDKVNGQDPGVWLIHINNGTAG